MLHFPQLGTYAVAQYPMSKRLVQRTIVNRTPGGATFKLTDPAAGLLEWDLPLGGLTFSEMTAIRTLFEASEGRLNSFLFVDPSDNLLRWSEDFNNAVWIWDPLVNFGSIVQGPNELASATQVINSSPAWQRIGQTVDVPAELCYSFSLYVRCAQPAVLRLRRSAGTTTVFEEVAITPSWRRVQSSGSLGAPDGPVRFDIEVPPATAVELFGAQVDAQPEPSAYRRTTSKCGVYPNARFQQDELGVTATATDQYALRVRIVSRLEE